MGQDSKIEWTHHTFNPWWGCVKVSPACKHCYAEAWATRWGSDVWGADAPRRFFPDAHWREPLKWNRQAAGAGETRRVFCASMADVFEDRDELAPWRHRLWALIEQTPHLHWLLLTKRPECMAHYLPWDELPANIWLGTTVENQKWANIRIPHLLDTKPSIRFLSCEPLLGPLDLSQYLDQGIDWVIAGGESGPKARPTAPAWLRALRHQCAQAAVPFLFKQWGNWAPEDTHSTRRTKQISVPKYLNGANAETFMWAVGKAKAGRLLDGEIWDGIPV